MNASQAACVVSALILASSSAYAQEVVAVPPGPDSIVPLRKGEPAPFDGQLFSNETAIRWANWLAQYKMLVKSDVDLQKKLCEADTQLLQKKLDLENQEYQRVTTELQAKLTKAQEEAANPPFYRTPLFNIGVGVVTTIAIIAGGAALVGAVK